MFSALGSPSSTVCKKLTRTFLAEEAHARVVWCHVELAHRIGRVDGPALVQHVLVSDITLIVRHEQLANHSLLEVSRAQI